MYIWSVKLFLMKTYIAITITDGSNERAEELLLGLNRLIMSPVKKIINVYDVSLKGVGNSIKRDLRSYEKYGVIYHRIKRGNNIFNENKRFNLGVAESLLHFNSIHSKIFDTYVHCAQNMTFSAHDLSLLVNNVRLYNAVSPVIESINGLEMWSAMFDRYGVTYSKSSSAPSFYITGAIEESYMLNPKCFGFSNRYAQKLKNFTISEREPVDYLNDLIFNNTDKLPVIDTGIFVHENLY